MPMDAFCGKLQFANIGVTPLERKSKLSNSFLDFMMCGILPKKGNKKVFFSHNFFEGKFWKS